MTLEDYMQMDASEFLKKESLEAKQEGDVENSKDIKECLEFIMKDWKEFYSISEFKFELEDLFEEFDKANNNTFAIYDATSYEFIGISASSVKGKISLKRNISEVFKFLVYGFTRNEISNVLHISVSYISQVVKRIREQAWYLKDFYEDLSVPVTLYNKF